MSKKGIFDIKFVDIDHQWADIFTKALAEERFNFIKENLGLVSLSDESFWFASDKYQTIYFVWRNGMYWTIYFVWSDDK